MELQGEQWMAATREQVWRALDDPEVLARCIPGCEEMRRIDEREIEARLLAKIGPVRAHFSGRVQRHDVVPPRSLRLSFEGSGGAAGMAKGESKVTLDEDNGGTRLAYTVDAAVGGKLGQIGGRLVNASAKKMADEFFQALNAQLAPKAAESAPIAQAHAVPVAVDAAPRPVTKNIGSNPWTAELQRLMWLVIGTGIGWIAARAFSL